MALILTKSVGDRCDNKPADVLAVQRLLAEHGFFAGVPDGDCDARTIAAIKTFQAIFLVVPDGKISPTGNGVKFLGRYKVKKVGTGVALPGQLQTAWDLLNPILPDGSYCSSGYRSADEQRGLLLRFFNTDFAADILAKFGQKAVDAAIALPTEKERDARMVAMLREVGQLIAIPGRSMHQQGKAFDIGGQADDEQVRVTKMVAKAHPTLFSAKPPLRERNGCVHVEIK